MNFKTLILVATLLIFAGSAQAATIPVQQVTDLVGTAQRRVLIYVPYLTDAGFANALRAAKVDRTRPHLQVIVVTVPFFAAKEDALSNALALAGVAVVESQVSSTTAYALVDDHLFASAQLGRSPRAADVQLLTKTQANAFLIWFKRAAKAGKVTTAFEAFNRLGGWK